MNQNMNKIALSVILGLSVVSGGFVNHAQAIEKQTKTNIAKFTQNDEFYFLTMQVSGHMSVSVDGKEGIAEFKNDQIKIPKDKVKEHVVVTIEKEKHIIPKSELDSGEPLPKAIVTPEEKFYKEWLKENHSKIQQLQAKHDSAGALALYAEFNKKLEAKFGKETAEKLNTIKFEDAWFTPAEGILTYVQSAKDAEESKKKGTEKKKEVETKKEAEKVSEKKDNVKGNQRILPKTSAIK